MRRATRHFSMLAAGTALALLAACGGEKASDSEVAALDNQLVADTPAQDPALRSALSDQIMVDPALAQQANAETVRPPAQPSSGGVPSPDIATNRTPVDPGTLRAAPAASGDCPQCDAAREALTLGSLASRTSGKACSENVAYSADWANRLPAGVPLYPDARVAEAAGNDDNGCALRVVSFTSAAPVQRMLDWYYTRTSEAGFTAQHQTQGTEHVLAGTKAGGRAFMVMVRPRGANGSEVDLIARGG